ncbi:MAG: diaminobutyrate acetyltransferase [Nitrincola lacisaponensis]|uniref:diaminobutyrate acetyltransferase n=1 Tax=Nitrincola lacisaponensis TaxID=267850 RepID=UPI003918E5F3
MDKYNTGSDTLIFRKPQATDGQPLNALVNRCPPLDTNSTYCNLLQCTHFADTSIAVENADQALVGFISGYIPPTRPDTLFVWQVAVDPGCRGQGLAQRMLKALVERCRTEQSIRYVETTITPGNSASEALFTRVYTELQAPIEKTVLFSRKTHFADQHDDEVLWRGGPLDTRQA